MSLFGPPDVGRLKQRRSIGPLAKAAGDIRRPGIAAEAVAALGEIYDPNGPANERTLIERTLLDALRSPIEGVWAAAQEASSRLGLDPALRAKALADQLRSGDPNVRAAAVNLIVGDKDPEALLAFLKRDERHNMSLLEFPPQEGAPSPSDQLMDRAFPGATAAKQWRIQVAKGLWQKSMGPAADLLANLLANIPSRFTDAQLSALAGVEDARRQRAITGRRLDPEIGTVVHEIRYARLRQAAESELLRRRTNG